jgi:hypothetical protein
MARSSGMGHFYYARHFGVLAAATVILFLLGQWSLLKDSLIVTFAINGALHASALLLTLRAPESLTRKSAFVAIAVALSVLTLYVGIISLVLFDSAGHGTALCRAGRLFAVGRDHLRIYRSLVLGA